MSDSLILILMVVLPLSVGLYAMLFTKSDYQKLTLSQTITAKIKRQNVNWYGHLNNEATD